MYVEAIFTEHDHFKKLMRKFQVPNFDKSFIKTLKSILNLQNKVAQPESINSDTCRCFSEISN